MQRIISLNKKNWMGMGGWATFLTACALKIPLCAYTAYVYVLQLSADMSIILI